MKLPKEIVVESSGGHEDSLKEQIKILRKELMDKSGRLETAMSDKSQLQNRVKILEDRGFDGSDKNLDTISRLTGKVEHLETEMKICEDRCNAINNQLETQTILCKDREKQVHQLQEELEAKEERLSTFAHELESGKQQVLQRERQIADLQDKFLQSSAHILEETIQ